MPKKNGLQYLNLYNRLPHKADPIYLVFVNVALLIKTSKSCHNIVINLE